MTEDEEGSPKPTLSRRVWTISISSSLLGSVVFFIFLQPILEFLSRSTSAILGTVAIGLLDQIYLQASFGILEPMVYFLVLLAMISIINIALLPATFWIVKRVVDEGGKEPSENSLARLKSSLKLSSAFSSLAVIVFSFFLLSMFFIGVQASSSFNRYMIASAPHLSENDEELLRARWALMTSRKEYAGLMADIEFRAAEGGWRLPRRLI